MREGPAQFAQYITIIAPCMGRVGRRGDRPALHVDKLTDGQKAKVVAEFKAGVGRGELSRKYNFHLDTISKWAAQAGCQRAKVEYNPETVEQAKAHRRAGMSTRKIAAHMGIPRGTIQAWVTGVR
jgi:hypothetical protein